MKLFLIFILLISFKCFGQIKSVNSVQSVMLVAPSATVTNTTTETEIFRDTVLANTLNYGRDYRVEVHLNVSTPVISIPSITVRFYFGATVATVVNSAVLAGSLSSAPLIVYGDLVTKGASSQIATFNQMQPGGTVVALSLANTGLRQSMTEDFTNDKIVRITVQLGGTVSASTVVNTDFILRRIF